MNNEQLQGLEQKALAAAQVLAKTRQEILGNRLLSSADRDQQLANARLHFYAETRDIPGKLKTVEVPTTTRAELTDKKRQALLDAHSKRIEDAGQQSLNAVLEQIVQTGDPGELEVIASPDGLDRLSKSLQGSGESRQQIDQLLSLVKGAAEKRQAGNAAKPSDETQLLSFYTQTLPAFIEDINTALVDGTRVVMLPAKPGSDDEPQVIDFAAPVQG